jgi:hypothetical protein
MIAGEFRASISLESFEREDAFDEGAVSLLSTVAASMGVALQNARLFDERSAVQAERTARRELAIVNSVQQGLAAELDFQAIIDLVGNKVAEIFGATDMAIGLYDRAAGTLAMPYYLEHGDRFAIETVPAAARADAPRHRNAPAARDQSRLQAHTASWRVDDRGRKRSRRQEELRRRPDPQGRRGAGRRGAVRQ